VSTPMFDRVAFIGMGLIGSSLAHVMRRDGLAGSIAACARKPETLKTIEELGLADETTHDPAEAVRGADLVMICTPLGTYTQVATDIGPHLKAGAIVSDVGSAKALVARDVGPHMPEGVHLVPGHPVAGTENSGPAAGFPELFAGRWCILTPAAGCDPEAVGKVRAMWEAGGMLVTEMDAKHHDMILAITSHLPHLIAYSIVDTAAQLGEDLQDEVFKFSASGFRDFTRIAASDPVMWRDIFIENRDAVLEMVNRFDEDLTNLKRAIRRGDGDELQRVFTRTREIRRGVIEARQETLEHEKIKKPD